MYAMNIADLTRYNEIVRLCLVAPVIQSRRMVEAEKGRMDGSAVVAECDDTRALAIIAILRADDKKSGRYPLRAYKQGARNGWTRVVQ